jgi:disulfide bond formation protein DsbB
VFGWWIIQNTKLDTSKFFWSNFMPFLRLSPRLYFLALFALCIGEVCFGAIYLQWMKGIEPCPMCIMQRYALLVTGLIALVGVLHNRGAIVYGVLITLVALAGGGVAARQTWLQLYPPKTSIGCGPGLEYMLETFPLTEVLPKLFRGEGDCSVVDWTLFGLSIANWGLVTFAGIVIVTPWVVWRFRRTKRAKRK